MISIDVWSDLLCPFCYIGKRHLELALARVGGDDAQVRWRSFQLDPGAERVSALTNDERLARKYGRSKAWAAELHAEITRRGAVVGLPFDFSRVQPTNSFDAHRLTHLAAAHGRADLVTTRLFEAHFAMGQRLGDHSVLAAIGGAVGLPAGEVASLLDGDAYAAEVRADDREGRERGVTGVPFFVFNGRQAVRGAQPLETFVAALRAAEGA